MGYVKELPPYGDLREGAHEWHLINPQYLTVIGAIALQWLHKQPVPAENWELVKDELRFPDRCISIWKSMCGDIQPRFEQAIKNGAEALQKEIEK